MSYCQLLGFRDCGFDVIEEYGNAHGWTAFVWTCLFDRYVKKRNQWDSWLMDPDRLWKLHNSAELEDYERFVLRSTFDRAMVPIDMIDQYIESLQSFLTTYQDDSRVCHIPKIIEALSCKQIKKYKAIGFYGMSVGDNPWEEYDEESDEYIDYDISAGNKHFFVDGDIETDD